MTALVVGVGNRLRRDDGVGPAVVDRVSLLRPDLDVAEVSGDASALLMLWAERSPVIVVDAVRTGVAPGTCHRWALSDGVWDALPPLSPFSTHLVGVRDAIDLAEALDRQPSRLVVVGVEAGDLGAGSGLSDPVAAALDDAVALVLGCLDPS